jgi:tetratricopeptide (TPR) repeat protein
VDAVKPDVTLAIVNRLKDAARVGPVASEALLRLGFFELRRDHPDAAIARFTEAGQAPDSDVRYLLHLLRGRALEQVNRRNDAIADYRAALAEFPFAQSATLALGTALAANGRVDESAALMSQMLAVPAPVYDPWTLYAVPDWRFWPGVIKTLRQAVRP